MAESLEDVRAEIAELKEKSDAASKEGDKQLYLAYQEQLGPLRKKEERLAAAMAMQPAANPQPGVSADKTVHFLQSIQLPKSVPAKADLTGLFQEPLTVSSGQPLRLPVHQSLYAMLAQYYSDGVEPEVVSQAWALSIAVTSALHPEIQLHADLGDELSVAGRVDELFSRFLSIMARLSGTSLTRKRNRTEQSITVKLARPDLLVLLRDVLMFKGEDKPEGGSIAEARQELQVKMQAWTTKLHGQIDYMLCYAAAGKDFQMCYLDRNNDLHQLTEVLGTNTIRGKLGVIHCAIRTFAIINQQVRMLPSDQYRLCSSITRENGTTISFMDSYVEKVVPKSTLEMWGFDVDDYFQHMCNVYTGVSNSVHLVHAMKGWPTCGSKNYRVRLEPCGKGLHPTWKPALPQLLSAIRCILLALQDLHAAGFGHGDVRWENVAQVSTWYILIDLELAVKLNSDQSTLANKVQSWEGGKVLDAQNHYTATSDLYQVGRLIHEMLDGQKELHKQQPALADVSAKLLAKQLTVEAALLAWPQ